MAGQPVQPSEQFKSFLKTKLEVLGLQVARAIRQIIDEPRPSEVVSLRLIVTDYETEGFPLFVVADDASGFPLDSEYVAQLNKYLSDLPALYSEEEEDEFVIWEAIDEGPPVHAIEQPMDGWKEAIFVPWFESLWRRVTKGRVSRPIYLCLEGQDFSLSLP